MIPSTKCGQLAEQFHPDQSAADDHEGELPAFALRVGLHVRSLETLDDVVAEQESIGEGLEGEGVLGTGDHRTVGPCPEGQNQLVVGQFTALSGGTQVDHPTLQVDALNRRLDEARGPQKGTDREASSGAIQGFRRRPQTAAAS